MLRRTEESTLCIKGQGVCLIFSFSVPDLLHRFPLSLQAYNTTVFQKERPGRGSIVGRATRYGLNGPAGTTFAVSFQRGPETHQPPVQGLPFLSQGERGWNVVLTTHPLLTPGLRIGWNYTFGSPVCLRKNVLGLSFTFTQI